MDQKGSAAMLVSPRDESKKPIVYMNKKFVMAESECNQSPLPR